MKKLLRDNIELNDINKINIHIEAYIKMLNFYKKHIEEYSSNEYLESRIVYLNSQLAEYMIAREMSLEKKSYIGGIFG